MKKFMTRDNGVRYAGTRHPDWPINEKKIFSDKTKQYADKIVDADYEKNKHKTPFIHVAENAAKELGFKWNSTTGTFRNNNDQTLPMKEANEINEALDKNFKDQKKDNYLTKLKKKRTNELAAKVKARRRAHYSKAWGVELDPKPNGDRIKQLKALKAHGENPYIKKDKLSDPITKSGLRLNYTKDKIEDADGDTVSMRDVLNEVEFDDLPTKHKKLVVAELPTKLKKSDRDKLLNKTYREDFEKEYGDQAIKNRVRAKEYKNIKEGRQPYEGFATHDIVVAETTKDEARAKLKEIKTAPITLEPTYLDYRIAAQKEPALTMSVDEYVARRVPTEIDPPGITALEEVREFKNTVDLANQKFPTRGRGLGPLLGEEK